MQPTHTGFSRSTIIGSLCIVFAGLLAAPAIAGDWSIIPRTTVTEEYTDNVTLVGQDTISDFITTITPGLSVRGTGARASLNVDYNLQNRIYQDNTEFDDSNHQLQSNVQLNPIKNILFLEGSASMSQRNGNNRQRRARQNRSRTGNRSDVLTFEGGPTLRHHLGRWADFQASYTKGGSINSGGTTRGLGSGSNEDVSYRLSTGRKFVRTPITLSYFEHETEYDSGRSDETKSFTADFGYNYSRKLTLNAQVGTDTNSFRGANNNRGDGFRWSVGGKLRPTPRTTIDGTWGQRGFGDTFNVSVRHEHRRLYFSLNYNEEVRTGAQRLRDVQLVPLVDLSGQPIFDLNQSTNFLIPDDTATINEQTSLSKRLGIQMEYEMRRTSFSGSYFQSNRTFQGGASNEDSESLQFAVSRQFWPRLSGSMIASWNMTDNRDGRSDEVFRFSPTLNYNLGPHTNLNFSYQYADSSGSSQNLNRNQNYIENALTANLTVFY